MRSSFSCCCLLAALALTATTSASNALDLQWQPRMSYDVSPDHLLGRHHPIVFANETHGFLLGGSTRNSVAANDFYVYDESNDEWTDLSAVARMVPARSFGYGVVLNEANHPKAYLGFGANEAGERLNDWWELDMTTLVFQQLTPCPCLGRRHPSMVPVFMDGGSWQIHVGLGDGYVGENLEFSNFNDYWSYDIETDQWTQLPDFPSTKRHHPFFFGLGDTSYTGLGHSDGRSPYIERDFYSYSTREGWTQEADFASYLIEDQQQQATLQTTEARVAGTEFAIELPVRGATNPLLEGALGFVLSGDGDDHKSMAEGEFHAFYPLNSPLLEDGTAVTWRQLTPHPGGSRWAPGSFVMRGTARAYFTSGYDRVSMVLHSDVWSIDLSPLFRAVTAPTSESNNGDGTTPSDETTAATPEEQDVTSDLDLPPTTGAIFNSTNMGQEQSSAVSNHKSYWATCVATAALALTFAVGA